MTQRLVVTVMFLALSIVTTQAQTATDKSGFGYVEAQTLNAQPQINLWLQNTKAEDKFGWYVWGQTSQAYSQIYGGATYQLTKDLQIGGGVGAEQANSPWRIAGFGYYTHGKYSILAIGEQGGSGPWYLVQVGRQLGPRINLSLHAQRFIGAGPRVDVALGKGFIIWGGYLKSDRNTTVVSLRKTFSF